MRGMHRLDKDVSERIAERLAALQGERTDEEMGALLGVHRVQYAHIKAGRRNLSYSTLKRAVQHFPELYPIVMRDLAPEQAAVAS